MISAAHLFRCATEAARLRALTARSTTEELFEKVAVIATTIARIRKLESGIPIGRWTEFVPITCTTSAATILRIPSTAQRVIGDALFRIAQHVIGFV